MEFRYFLYSLLLLNVLSYSSHAQHNGRAIHGHAHNDYLQDLPLETALELGFTSIEIDVYSFRSEIKVAHLPGRLQSRPTLEDLYIRPLKALIEDGKIGQSPDEQITLMIDLKSDKYLLIPMLRSALKPIRQYIDTDGDHELISGPIRIMLSGNPDIEAAMTNANGIFCFDGRLDQSGSYTASVMPRVSVDYRDHFNWKGRGTMPAEETARLNELVADVHAQGRKIRFWNSPNDLQVWKSLLEAGVDWINVDDLEMYSEFIRNDYQQIGK